MEGELCITFFRHPLGFYAEVTPRGLLRGAIPKALIFVKLRDDNTIIIKLVIAQFYSGDCQPEFVMNRFGSPNHWAVD